MRGAALLALVAGSCFVPTAARAQVSCSYALSPVLEFGTTTGLPTPQIDVVATISVTCTSLLSVNHRVCLSIPEGTGGASIADRRMLRDGHFVQYQLYTNQARTTVWGALGETSPPRAVDFPALIGSRTEDIPVFARVFAGQTGKAVGLYESDLTPIVARRQGYILIPPGCQTVTGSATTLAALPVRLTIATSCTIAANPLEFGTVAGLIGHSATTNLSVACTLDGPYTIALDGGSVAGDVDQRQMQLEAGTATIDYQLFQDGGHAQPWGEAPGSVVSGTGTGAAQSIPIFGFVPPQGARPQGTYQDVVTVTITF